MVRADSCDLQDGVSVSNRAAVACNGVVMTCDVGGGGATAQAFLGASQQQPMLGGAPWCLGDGEAKRKQSKLHRRDGSTERDGGGSRALAPEEMDGSFCD